jgi:hypothetical protein
MPNHDVNAAKKQNHEEWKLRMCGRAILHNANCLAFPKSSSSIFLELIFLSILVLGINKVDNEIYTGI